MSTAPPAADRTVRQRTLPQIGDSGQRLLAGASVAVVGAGGLGSPVLQYLAAAGLGTVHVFDDDTVELSNLNRQTLHGVDTIGRLKTEGAVAAAARLSPETTVVPHPVRLTDANARELLDGVDVILDGSDSFTTRFIVHRAATALGLPVVYGALMQWNAQVTVFWSAPPAGSGWPATVLTDLFEDNAATHAAPGCAEAGVLGAVVGITGSFMALEAMKLILGTGRPLLGRLLLIDGLAGTTSEIPLGTTTAGPVPVPGTPAAVPVADVGDEVVWLDVRRPEESAGRPGPAGTVLMPLDALLRLGTGPTDPLPEEHPLASVRASGTPLMPFCVAGPRSVTAARHLASLGWPVRGYLDGGLPDDLGRQPEGANGRSASCDTGGGTDHG